MSRESAEFLNRIGLLLGFFSFWFVVPEFIPEQRLKSLEQAFAAGLLKLPWALQLLLHTAFLAGMGIYTFRVFSDFEVSLWPMSNVPQWLLLTIGVLSAMVLISSLIVRRVVSKLANDARARQRALAFGALLFITSFLLQFIATFQAKPLN